MASEIAVYSCNLARRLMKAIRDCEAVYAATPPGREGELMAWQVLARAGNWSGLVLGAGCIMALGNYLLHANGNLLFHGILLSLLVATVAESGFQLWLFRRGH